MYMFWHFPFNLLFISGIFSIGLDGITPKQSNINSLAEVMWWKQYMLTARKEEFNTINTGVNLGIWVFWKHNGNHPATSWKNEFTSTVFTHPCVCFYALLDIEWQWNFSKYILSFPATDWLEPIICHIRRNETRIQPPLLSSKRKHQINKPEWRELFCLKCHLAVAESPEDQRGSPQASTAVHPFPFLVLVLPLSISSHTYTHKRGLFLSSEMSINTYSHCLGGREMCISINRFCELPTHPDIRRTLMSQRLTRARFSGVMPWGGSLV